MPNHLHTLKLASATLTLCLVFPLSLASKTGNLDALAQVPVPSGASQRDDDSSTPNRKIEADRLFQIGVGQLQTNQLQPALTTFQQVLAIRREMGDKLGEKETLLKLAEVYQKQGQNDRAQEYFRQAEAIRNSAESAIAQTPVQPSTVVQTTQQAPPITQVAQTPQRDDDSSLVQPSAVVQTTQQRDDDQQPNTLNIQISPIEAIALGQSLPQSGQAQAIAQTPQRDDDPSRQTLSAQTGAGAIAQTPQRDDDPSRIASVSDRKIEADRLFQTGVQQLQTNQLQTALTTFQQVVAIRKQIGDKMGLGQALFQIGKVYDRLSQPQQAQNYYRQARELGVQ